MQAPTLKALLTLLLTVGILVPTPARAGAGAAESVQDPPVIPRALLKRPGPRPQRFVRTELFFGTASSEGRHDGAPRAGEC